MVNYNFRLIKCLKKRFNDSFKYLKVEEVFDKFKIDINDLYENEYDDLMKFCYFCGEKRTIDKHHVIPKSHKGKNEISNLIPLCPNHHAYLHRGISGLIYIGGYFIMVYSSCKKDFPYSVNKIIRRYIYNKPILISYKDHSNNQYEFNIEDLEPSELIYYKSFSNIIPRGIKKW